MRTIDTLGPQRDRIVLDIYEGDVVREPVTRDEAEINRLWRELGERYDIHGHLVGREPDACAGIRKIPVFAGLIVSKPVDLLVHDDLVVTTGKQLILDRAYALGSVGALTHMGVGASATAAAVGDTQLNTTPTLLTFDALPTRSSLVVTAIRTFATGEANINWQEIAQFNGGTNGTSTMLNRIAPIGPFTKTSAVSIAATMTLTQA